jgi:multiple sugar transport system substrate-binding protein
VRDGTASGTRRGGRSVRARVACLAGLAAVAAACAAPPGEPVTTIRFWAMGREGEVVQDLVRDFERENPDIRVIVQQIPWSAAHEKLLTAFVGRATPDVAQLGNTWVAEFATLRALEPLDARVAATSGLDPEEYFSGIWDTNVIDGTLYGVPWYVDTRVLFYRRDILARAGYDTIPDTWDGWREAMRAVKRVVGPENFAVLLPVNEWTAPVVLGLQAGSPLLRDHDTRGAFTEPAFRRAFAFYLDLFREGLAPPLANNEIANVYQEFEKGYFSMYLTGPWNLGEFHDRISPELADAWATAPLPGPDGPGVSLAGGSSLVLFRRSQHRDGAWRLVTFLSRPGQQLRFRRLSGDLPARRAAWEDSSLAGDPRIRAFREQLERVVPTPKIPEWELITSRILEAAELAARNAAPPDTALARLDRDVNRILEKRRWLLARNQGGDAETGGTP